SALYQWPITIAATTTVKARAYKDSFTPSAVATAAFALDAAGAVDTPLIVPAGGRFTAGVTAIVTVQASGATLRYTTTGVDPTASDPVVPGSGITVDRSMVVKVKAWSGTVWSWGSNLNDRLGDTSAGRTSPAQVSGLSGIIAVAAGETHSLALKNDGTVWTFGGNGAGQLGDGTTADRAAPAMVPGLSG